MKIADIHVHSSFSADSDADMGEEIEKAISLGLPTICFTDHIDWDFPDEEAEYTFDPKAYFSAISEMRERYGDRISVLAGVELGLQPHLADAYSAFLAENTFDFVIGSQHLVFGEDPYYKKTFEGRSDEEVYRAYFEETLAGIRAFHAFDSMGHLDYVVRYGKNRAATYRYRNYADIIDEILKLLVRSNIALELNTAGLRKRLGFPNPHPDILRRYRELGGTLVTVGSDSHKPHSIGFGFEYAGDILRSCGFTHYVYFKKRKPVFVKL